MCSLGSILCVLYCMCCIVCFVPFEIKLHVVLFMSMIRKDMEKVRLFHKVRIICAAATISTCKPKISQNCDIASIYQAWKASMAKQGRRKPATIFGGKFPNYCDGSLRERKKRQMRFDKFWPRVFICAPFVLFWTVCHFDSSSGPLTIFKNFPISVV